MNTDKIAIKEINYYETEFDGSLKFQYKNNLEKFYIDLTNEIKTNGIDDFIKYYKTYLKGLNDTNSTNEKRLALENLILLLQGCKKEN